MRPVPVTDNILEDIIKKLSNHYFNLATNLTNDHVRTEEDYKRLAEYKSEKGYAIHWAVFAPPDYFSRLLDNTPNSIIFGENSLLMAFASCKHLKEKMTWRCKENYRAFIHKYSINEILVAEEKNILMILADLLQREAKDVIFPLLPFQLAEYAAKSGQFTEEICQARILHSRLTSSCRLHQPVASSLLWLACENRHWECALFLQQQGVTIGSKIVYKPRGYYTWEGLVFSHTEPFAEAHFAREAIKNLPCLKELAPDSEKECLSVAPDELWKLVEKSTQPPALPAPDFHQTPTSAFSSNATLSSSSFDSKSSPALFSSESRNKKRKRLTEIKETSEAKKSPTFNKQRFMGRKQLERATESTLKKMSFAQFAEIVGGDNPEPSSPQR